MDEERGELVDFVMRGRKAATARVLDSFDQDPDEAAEAISLGKKTGVDPSLINTDLDTFKNNMKVRATSSLVNSNEYIEDFINRNPMAAKVSHDDIGNLDKLTQTVGRYFDARALMHPLFASAQLTRAAMRAGSKGPSPFERGAVSTFLGQNPDLAAEFLEGWSHAAPDVASGQMLAGAKKLREIAALSPEEYKKQHESLWEVGGPMDFLSWVGETVGSAVGSSAIPAALGAAGGLAGSFGGPIGTVAGAAAGGGSASYVMNYGEVYKALKAAGIDPKTAHTYAAVAAGPMAALDVGSLATTVTRFGAAMAKKEIIDNIVKRVAKEGAIGGAVEGATEAAQEVIKDIAVSTATNTGLLTKEHAMGWVENAIAGFVGGAALTAPAGLAGPSPAMKAKPWLDAGKDPPAGIDPTIDKLKVGQGEMDMERLNEIVDDAESSQLRERSPEMLSNLLRRQIGEHKIEIPTEAVFELYGNKPVTPDDGLLGWIPDLEAQMRQNYPKGGYIAVPFRDWAANVPKDIRELLNDHILTRPAGLSINDGKVMKEKGKALAAFDVYHGTPHFFDVFDLSKALTGEGAMVRGAGAYFGQAKGTAESYAQPRAPRGYSYWDLTSKWLQEAGGDVTKALATAEAFVRENRLGIKEAHEIYEDIRKPPAHLLKTRIHAELEQFLDLDKPLVTQASAIREAVLRLLPRLEGIVTGEQAYRAISKALGGDKQASEALRQAGIPGSKYLDQFSRTKGEAIVRHQRNIEMMEAAIARGGLEGDQLTVVEDSLAESKAIVAEAKDLTYNIVLFDPALAQIIERNGQAIATVRQGAGLGALTDLGPQAEWMLMQNRLQVQAIMDKLNQAKTPEEMASVRKELKEVQRALKTLGRLPGISAEPGWQATPATERVTIEFAPSALEVQPISTDTLGQVLGKVDFKPLAPLLGPHLQVIVNRIHQLAANTPVHVVSDRDFVTLIDDAGANPNTAAVYSIKEDGSDQIYMPESIFRSPRVVKHLFHEAIHAATSRALFQQPALTFAIEQLMGDLVATDPKLSEQYGFRDKDAHEFLAEAISNKDLQDMLASIELSESHARALGMEDWKGKTLWQGIVEYIRRVLGIPKEAFSALEGALRLTEVAMQAQEGVLARQGGMAKAAMGPGDIFAEARLVGLTIEQYALMMQKRAERTARDAEFLVKQVEKFVRKRQTAEWKLNESRMKTEVEDQMLARPDIALSTFFRTGRLYGIQQGIPKIDPKQLTPEQRKLIPAKWQSAKGGDPIEFAAIVGYTSVDQMAQRADALEKAMQAQKQPSLRKYVDGLIKAETERRMMKEFGGLEENILAEVQDHVISPSDMEYLHEDTVAIGMKYGWSMPFTKQEITAGVKAQAGTRIASEVSEVKDLRDSGKAGKLSGIAMLEGNEAEFFKQRQKQEYAIRYANESKVVEKELKSFENTAKQLSRRESKTIDQAYFNFIQNYLDQAGIKMKNSREEINANLAAEPYSSIEDFITHMKGKHGTGQDLDLFVPENYKPKPFDEMTVDEFREFKDIVEALEEAGRNENKIMVKGEKEDWARRKGVIIGNLLQMPIRHWASLPKGGNWFYQFDAWRARPEEMVKDLDLREELGPLFEALIVPQELSKSKFLTMVKALSDTMKKIGKTQGGKAWQGTLSDEIPQDFIFDKWYGVPYKLDRWNMIRMMLNVGNTGRFSNKEKLARGIASSVKDRIANAEETAEAMTKIDALIDKHATKADWDFVQSIWDIFAGWKDEEDTLARNTTGKVPKWIKPTPIQTKFGEYAGGYIPLENDTSRPIFGEDIGPKISDKALTGSNFYRATTHRPHHLERTGAVYFVDINSPIESLAGRMQQHIHDIAYRDFVMNASKIIYDKEIAFHIKNRYGIEYYNQLDNWVRRVANDLTINEKEHKAGNTILRFFRLNLTAAAIPGNYAVMYSPTVGTMNVVDILKLGAETQENRKRILDQSEELKHVLYTIDRDLTEQLGQIAGGRGMYAKWTSTQRKYVEMILKPLVMVEQETRSTTFYGEWMRQKAKGRTDEEAATMADSIVRERHGAVSPGDLPTMLASKSEFLKAATLFMGYFNMISNWSRQIPGQVRRGDVKGLMTTVWGTVIVAAIFNAAFFTKRKKDDTVWSFLSRAVLDTPMTMTPGVREWYKYETDGFKPTTPLFNFGVAIHDVVKDGFRAWEGKPVKKPIKHMFNLLGQGIGMPAAVQTGRTGELAWDVARGEQRPRDFTEWVRGLHTGEARLKK